MADYEISDALALELATTLKLIPGFPWDALGPMAECLQRWCKGGVFQGQEWPPEAQARWLVTQAVDSWEEWNGANDLRVLLRSKFNPPQVPNEVVDYANAPCVCGSGEKFKACCMGKPMFPVVADKIKSISPRPVGRRTAEDQARLDQIAEDIARVEAERKKGA